MTMTHSCSRQYLWCEVFDARFNARVFRNLLCMKIQRRVVVSYVDDQGNRISRFVLSSDERHLDLPGTQSGTIHFVDLIT
jgi:hypothetical protein